MNANVLKKRLARAYFFENSNIFAINLALRIILGATDIVLSYMLMKIIDCALYEGMDSFKKNVLICCGAIVLNMILQFAMRFTYAAFLKKGALNYKKIVFEEILDKRIDEFQKENYNSYISALTNDVITMEKSLYENVFVAITSVLMLFAALILMLKNSVELTVVVLALMLLPLAVSIISGDRLANYEKNTSDKNEAFVSMISDFLLGFAVLKSFKIENYASSQFNYIDGELENAKYERRKIARLIEMMDSSAQTISQFGIFIVGSYLALSNRNVTIGMVTMFLQMMNYIFEPLNVLPPFWAAVRTRDKLTTKLSNMLTAGRESHELSLKTKFSFDDSIKIKNVCFSYENNDLTLDDMTYEFKKGKRYAIVGASGSGKTTLINILNGTLKSYSGTVCYDNHEIKDILSDSLYEKISVLQQNVIIFNDSIRNNITLFKNYDDEALKNAINDAGLGDLVAEKGLDYICGVAGVNLSGGERQRIALARCLISNCKVLFLDEATSSLDKMTANTLLNTVLDATNLTCIIITHQLEKSIMEKFDEIIAINKGKIVESGKYAELIEMKGYFYSLFNVGNV